MQRKDLALRVLSTAAIMSIVTSIAAPAFADIYYIGKGSIDVETVTDANGEKYVKVTQGGTTYEDKSKEIVIKDGTSEADTTLTEAKRAEGTRANPAVAPAAGAATQELEAAGTADAAGPAAGESQPDPDAAFTLSETGEDSAQNQEGEDTTKKDEDTTEPSTDNPKKDVVYEYDPAADPEPEQQATKPASTATAKPEATAPETTLAAAPTAAPAADPATPAEGSAKNPTKNVIRVINNWVGEAAKELKIRLSNVNIKQDVSSTYADGTKEEPIDTVSGMTVKGSGNTKLELDGQNVLDSRNIPSAAGLYKDNGDGWLTITDETDDQGKEITSAKKDGSGSLTAQAQSSYGGAAIGGVWGKDTKNIIIEGYATVNAFAGGDSAGIGGGGSASESGDAENIIIRGHSKVTATASGLGAAIGGGRGAYNMPGGSATGIQIYGHATVEAINDGGGAAIGAASDDNCKAEVTIGTAGATAEQEDVHVTATSKFGAAIGNGRLSTKVIIQGNTTIEKVSSENDPAIGSSAPSDTSITIKDNAHINTIHGGIYAIGGESGDGKTVTVNIDGGENGNVVLGDVNVINGKGAAISGTSINIGDHVLIKLKQRVSTDSSGKKHYNQYLSENNAEKTLTTVGDNTALWYTDYNNKLQKIVHGKNLCTKHETSHQDATCTEKGWKEYGCTLESDNHAAAPTHTDSWKEYIPALGHDWKDNGEANHICDRDHVTAAHTYGDWVVVTPATCTAAGQKQRTCTECGHVETEEIPATGHHWKDNGDGTHTCTKCGATEGQPFNTNSALELRVVDAEGMDQPFTVSQNGTLRTYTGAYDIATLTGDLDTLRYLQEHGAQTIQFVTNGQTSSFAINDLLAQGSGSEVFYLTHRGAEEPTLLLVEADHSDLVKD